METEQTSPIEVLIIAVPETAGSALYGMVDVLLAAGNIWESLLRADVKQRLFNVHIVSLSVRPFSCGNRIPVNPEYSLDDDPSGDIVILPELWLEPDEDIAGRYSELMEWLHRKYKGNASLYSACSGAILLAVSGSLDGCPATSHWGYQDLFRQRYPRVRFLPEPNLVFADPSGRIVTAGGTTSWHDLALHIISRHAGTGEALRIAKVYLLKWHAEVQFPYAPLVRNAPHADSIVHASEGWQKDNFRENNAVQKAVEQAKIPERTFKRRFKAATGSTLIEYLQNLRIEEAKRLLETGQMPVDEISIQVSYEDQSFLEGCLNA